MIMTTTTIKSGYKQTELGVIPVDWDVKKFKDKGVTELITCGIAATPQYVNENIGVPFLSSTNVKNGKISWDNFKYISKNLHKLLYKNNPPLKGDILYSRVGTIGEAAVIDVDFEFSIYVSLTLIKTGKLVYNEFLKQLLNSTTYKTLAKNTVLLGGGVGNLNVNVVREFPITLPSFREQIAIATILSDTDTLIEHLEKLIAKKKAIKQATMQQLLTGKTRLPGFSEELEVKKVGEIGEKFVNGGTPSTQKPEYWQGNIPWITGADVINQKISDIRRFITTEAVKNSSTNIVERGNLLVVTRTGVGKLAVAPFDVAISQDITGIYVKKEQVLVEYLFYYFNYNSESLKSLNQGTSIAGITRETLLSTNVSLPSFLEQKAIVNILTDMDAEIVALEQKREKIRALKQGMMQELLTGKTRLV